MWSKQKQFSWFFSEFIILFTFSYFIYNDLNLRAAPSWNGMQVFSVQQLVSPPPLNIYIYIFFFWTICPLSQIHHDFWRGKHLAPLGCCTTLSFADKNNTKVIQSKHKSTFGVTVNYVLWTADVWKHLHLYKYILSFFF